ncbi:WD40 repeat domain-containing serine/threonine protein kinase [Streptomyces sp. PSAA01]|uniref:WD40 repeat domain-containing serine/threonine protein kinase n=1 Tax=Streptomyces sp. PSAA01 TaxID=2912762 RepID=UPI001F2B757F|nr:serine/threonine-protein kinase [Streptomyces sp. PSAA01]MCG0286713.1 serine/threonine protein kinase [Streptomyces sp. PSAA01]
MEPLQVGDPRQVGPYRLLGRLGRGGMGRVFVGRSRGGHMVAVKLVHPEIAGDPRFRRRFAQEVDSAQRVGGFYTAQVVDADPGADPPWLVTAYIAGPSLQHAVDTHGPLPVRSVTALGAGLAEALSAIHGAGLVHRDLKPSNIILAGNGPRVIDFGISRALDATHTSTSVVGTPGFMPPEQAMGLDVGPAGDVFALGAVLVFAATGRGPFGAGPVASILYRIVHEAPNLAGVPAPLSTLVAACLAKNPDQRLSVADILEQMEEPSAAVGTWFPPAVTTMISEREREPYDQTDTPQATIAWGATFDAPRPPSPEATTTGTPNQPGHEGRSSRLRVPGAPVTLFDSRDAPLRSVAFNPSATLLAGAGEDGTVRLWDPGTQEFVRSLSHQAVNPWDKPLAEVLAFNPQFCAALSVAFSPDGTGLAVGNGDGTVSLWDVADGSEIVLPYLDEIQWNGSSASVCFSPVDAMVAATYDAPAIRLWDVAARTSMATLATGDGYWVAQVAFSPCGRILASASGNGNPNNTVNDGLLQLWDTSSGAEMATLAETNSPAWQPLAFSPDGKTLASLRSDGQITLWDIASRQATATITGPRSGVTCVAFGSNGVLAGGFLDGTVTLWDAASGRSIAVLATRTNNAVSSLAFSPDGAFLASATRKLTVWPLEQ